jgi:hypothetical protein
VQVTSPIDLAPRPSDRYDPAALWWRHEELHRTATLLGQEVLAEEE